MALLFNTPLPLAALNGLPRAPTIAPECEARSFADKELMIREVEHYEGSPRFRIKVQEARGQRKVDARIVAIGEFLRRTGALDRVRSVLDLGCAAGAPLQYVARILKAPTRNLAGVELVGKWVDVARETFGRNATFVNADITDDLGLGSPPPKFDLVMLNDVLEHVLVMRYPCLWRNLHDHTHLNSLVYFHTPSPETQLDDREQFYENLVPHHQVIAELAAHGFQLEHFEMDRITDCQSVSDRAKGLSRGALCLNPRGTSKYTHMVFRKTDAPVFASRQQQQNPSAEQCLLRACSIRPT